MAVELLSDAALSILSVGKVIASNKFDIIVCIIGLGLYVELSIPAIEDIIRCPSPSLLFTSSTRMPSNRLASLAKIKL
jgi:hypothetical protein